MSEPTTKSTVTEIENVYYVTVETANKLFGLSRLFEMDNIGTKSFDQDAMHGIADMLRAIAKDVRKMGTQLDELATSQRS